MASIREKLTLLAGPAVVSPAVRRAGRSGWCVWRDALGPGYAIGPTEQMVDYAALRASSPYQCSDSPVQVMH